jgi:hypothetical protein
MPGYRQRLADVSTSSSSKCSTNSHASVFTPLGSLSVNLWTEGALSAIAVQKIAHCAFLNPWQQDDLVGLAALGSFGVHDGNVKRDLQRLVEAALKPQIPNPMGIKALVLDHLSSLEESAWVHINSPADLLASMFHNYQISFAEWFRVDQVQEFWEAVHPEDPKLKSLFLETGISKKDLSQVIPLRLHGDGVEFQNK